MRNNFLVKVKGVWKSYEVRVSLFKKVKFWAVKGLAWRLKEEKVWFYWERVAVEKPPLER